MLLSHDSVGRIALTGLVFSHVTTVEYQTVRRGPANLGREFADPVPSFTTTLYKNGSGELGQNPGKPRQQVAEQMTEIYMTAWSSILTPRLGMVVSERSVPRSIPEAYCQVIVFIRRGCIEEDARSGREACALTEGFAGPSNDVTICSHNRYMFQSCFLNPKWVYPSTHFLYASLNR